MDGVMSGLAVVIPFYGDPAPTLHLVSQLQQQEGAPPLQIIIADDCSPTPFPDGAGYEVVRRATNGGFGANVNSGMAAVKYPVTVVLNSDVEIEPDLLRRWCGAAAPWMPAVTAPAMYGATGRQARVTRRFHSPAHIILEWARPLARLHRFRWFAKAAGHDLDALNAAHATPTDWLVGAALMFPTDAFHAVGGFDERFFMNCEEVDLQRRLRAIGVPAIFLPEISLRHEGSGSSAAEKRLGWVVDSRFQYMAKWGGRRRLLIGLVAASVVNFLWNAVRKAFGRREAPRERLCQELTVIRHGWKVSK